MLLVILLNDSNVAFFFLLNCHSDRYVIQSLSPRYFVENTQIYMPYTIIYGFYCEITSTRSLLRWFRLTTRLY